MKNRLLILLRISCNRWVASLLLLSRVPFVLVFSQFDYNVSQNGNLFWVYPTGILWASCVDPCFSSDLRSFWPLFLHIFFLRLSLLDSHKCVCLYSWWLLSPCFLFCLSLRTTNVYCYTDIWGAQRPDVKQSSTFMDIRNYKSEARVKKVSGVRAFPAASSHEPCSQT